MSYRTMAARWSSVMRVNAAAIARLRSAWTAVRSGSASTPAGGCQLSSSNSGYGWTGRRFRARWVSIAALTQIRFSQDFTLPPRNEDRLRYAEKNASWTQSEAWSRSGTMRTTSANNESWYSTTRSLNASRSPDRARSMRMRSRRWTGSSVTVVERRSSTVWGSLRTAMLADVRRGESSIGRETRVRGMRFRLARTSSGGATICDRVEPKWRNGIRDGLKHR